MKNLRELETSQFHLFCFTKHDYIESIEKFYFKSTGASYFTLLKPDRLSVSVRAESFNATETPCTGRSKLVTFV